MGQVLAPPLGNKVVGLRTIPIWLYGLFFLSGISSLMYEVVWIRVLTRILGSTVYATATALAAFMLGLALGSFLAGRFIDRARRSLFWYALLEIGIGLSAMASLILPEYLAPAYKQVYDMFDGSRAAVTAAQVLVALAVLLLPTLLMGATLPTLTSFSSRSGITFGRYVGMLYALNTFGGVVGTLASGYVLIGLFGETATVLIGTVLNGLVAVTALVFGSRLERSEPDAGGADEEAPVAVPAIVYPAATRRLVIACFAASGMVTLAYEVAWGRMLTLYLGTSIYSFSAMLVVILTGITLGSLLAGAFIDRCRDPMRVLTVLMFLSALAGAISLHLYPLPERFLPAGATGGFSLKMLVLLFVLAALMVGPIGLLSGMMFPVAARCCVQSRQAPGRAVGELYAWNTLGCIVGSLLGGFALIPVFGVAKGTVALAGVSLLLAIVLVAAHPENKVRRFRFLDWSLAGLCGFLLLTVGDPYFKLIQERAERKTQGNLVLYAHVDEAAGTTTAFGADDRRQKNIWVNGVGMTTLTPTTKLLAHLPIWLADDCRDVIVVCYGMGTSVRSASRHPNQEIHVVELVPAVLRSAGYFHEDGPAILAAPNVHPVIDDGRNYLSMNRKQYDVNTIDPPPPLHSAGTVNLYTREFFQLCKSRLKDGGVMCLWIPPGGESELRMIMATYIKVFDYVQTWSGETEDPGVIMIGSRKPIVGIEERVRKGFRNQDVKADLTEWGECFSTPEKIMGLYLCDQDALRHLLTATPTLTDDHPYTEFPLWRALFNREKTLRILTASDLRRELSDLGAASR